MQNPIESKTSTDLQALHLQKGAASSKDYKIEARASSAGRGIFEESASSTTSRQRDSMVTAYI